MNSPRSPPPALADTFDLGSALNPPSRSAAASAFLATAPARTGKTANTADRASRGVHPLRQELRTRPIRGASAERPGVLPDARARDAFPIGDTPHATRTLVVGGFPGGGWSGASAGRASQERARPNGGDRQANHRERRAATGERRAVHADGVGLVQQRSRNRGRSKPSSRNSPRESSRRTPRST